MFGLVITEKSRNRRYLGGMIADKLSFKNDPQRYSNEKDALFLGQKISEVTMDLL